MSAPTFFVPAATPETQERDFAWLAAYARQPVPQLNERIYSITYVHDGEEWIATVGESLRGTKRRVTRSKGRKIERVHSLSDPAVVRAIFSGEPYLVVTNQWLPENVGSAWQNPFFAAPKSVTYFRPDASR
jgi:hypothetical protein